MERAISGSVQRRHFIDWARGVAVVAMVLWHTADGWLLSEVRTGHSWSWLRFVGGLAAPSFIFLAGVGSSLAARPERSAPTLLIAASRGLEILLLGYVMRYQTWVIDAGAIIQPVTARAYLPLGLGYGLLYASLRLVQNGSPQARRAAIAGALLCLLGFAQIPWLAPGRLPRLLQVDVLQCIGASLTLLALGEHVLRLLQRPRLLIAIGVLIALATEPIGQLLPGLLPVPIAAYLGKFAVPASQPSPTLFPLLPWLSYACFGAAFGTVLRRGDDDRVVTYAGLAGALLALSTSEALPFVQHAIASLPWSVHPLRVAFRVGLVLVLLMLGWLWADGRRGRLLVAYGTASLRVYWAHLFVAYGLLGRPFHKGLSLPAWAAGALVLLGVMWLLTRVRLGGRSLPRSRPAPLPSV